jgi:hypothetical protein
MPDRQATFMSHYSLKYFQGTAAFGDHFKDRK